MNRLDYFTDQDPAGPGTPVSGAAAGQSEPHSAPGRVPPRVGAGDGTAAGPCAPAPGPAAPMTAVSRSPQGPQGRDTVSSGTGAESPPRSPSVQPGGSPRQPGVTAAPAIPVGAGGAVTQTPPEDAPDSNAPSGGTTGREEWKRADSAYKAAQRRGRGRYRTRTPGQKFTPGMSRRMPPGGDS